jgi:hypothetical protein
VGWRILEILVSVILLWFWYQNMVVQWFALLEVAGDCGGGVLEKAFSSET